MIKTKWEGKKLVTFKNKKPDQHILEDFKIDSKRKVTFTVLETSKLLRVSRSVIDQAIRLNEMPHLHLRNRILITLPLASFVPISCSADQAPISFHCASNGTTTTLSLFSMSA